MKYAIIRINGQQYKAIEGKELLIDFQGENAKLAPEVLMVNNDGKYAIGTPVLEKAAIALTVLESEEKGEKVHVRKFRSKSRYRKHVGFRPKHTRVKVEKIA